MGRKINENINKKKETEERYEDGLEASELAKEDFQQGQEVVEGVQELDVDDEVKDVTTRVGEGIRQEAESFMRDEVGGIMEEGTELSNETEEHANENAELNHEAADRFAESQRAAVRLRRRPPWRSLRQKQEPSQCLQRWRPHRR